MRRVSCAVDESDPPAVPNMWLNDASPPPEWIVPTNPYVMAGSLGGGRIGNGL